MAPLSLALFAGLLVFALTLVISLVGLELALVPLHRARRRHWSAQAQALLGGRVFVHSLIVSVPVFAALGMAEQARDAKLDPFAFVVIGAAAAWLALRPAVFRLQRASHAPFGLTRYLGSALFLRGMFGLPLVIALGAACLAPRFDLRGVVVLAGAAAISIYALPLAFRVLRSLGLVRPAGQRLHALNQAVAARLGQSPPRAFEALAFSPNAFALVGSRAPGVILVTDSALAALADDELAAILAHEHGHLHHHLTLANRVLVSLRMWPLAALPACVALAGWPAAMLPLLLTFGLLVHAQRVLGRAEAHADGVGQAHEGDAGTYARALEKLYQAGLLPVVGFAPGVHGHLYDRLRAAGVEPGFPRPAPPALFGPWLLLCAAFASLATGYLELCYRYLPALRI